MFDSIELISYHALAMLLPLLFYHLFSKEEKYLRGKVFSKLFLVSLVMLFLTMSNPVQYSNGFQFDFRVIPIIITFLFGGLRPGIIIIGVMLLYRYSFGGDGFAVALLNYSIAALVLLMIKRRFETYSLKQKLFFISGFYWFIELTRAIIFWHIGKVELITVTLILSATTWITLIILVFIIINLDIQIENFKHIQSAERLNAVSQLAASVAHEVRNPMTSVKGFLQLIKLDQNLNENQYKYIRISLEELERTEAIINDYLSLAKPVTKDSVIKIDITSEINSMIDIITSYTKTHNIVIQSSIQEGLFSKGKKGEFKQAILNIMKNSVEAIHTNGTLTVNAYRENQSVYIEIVDDGIGMTQKQVSQLGTPYYSTKDKGTGVGLTITYKVIKDMNGKITVQSKKDVGTTFKVELPLATAKI